MDPDVNWPSDWMRAALELCALATVVREPSHGYAIATRLGDHGFGAVKGGTLYPLLGRLEAVGLVSSTWQAGEGGPGRKVFTATDLGRRELARRIDLWRAFITVTSHYLDAAAAPPTTDDATSSDPPSASSLTPASVEA